MRRTQCDDCLTDLRMFGESFHLGTQHLPIEKITKIEQRIGGQGHPYFVSLSYSRHHQHRPKYHYDESTPCGDYDCFQEHYHLPSNVEPVDTPEWVGKANP